MIPLLIGASGSFNRSPSIPLSFGRHRITVTGVADTVMSAWVSSNNKERMLCDGDIFEVNEAGVTLHIVNSIPGTERNSIFVSVKRLNDEPVKVS